MTKIKEYLKTIRFSLGLIYRSSGLTIVLYGIICIVNSLFYLADAYALKLVVDGLTGNAPDRDYVLICVGIYILSLILRKIMSTVEELSFSYINKKARHLYECMQAQRLEVLPMSFIDSSKGRDIIDDVRYGANATITSVRRLFTIIASFGTFTVAYVTLAEFNLWFSLLVIVLVIPGIILNTVFDRKAEALRRKQAPDVRKFCYYRWMLTDAWPAKDVRMYDLTDDIKGRYNEEKDDYVRANKRLDAKKARMLTLAEVIRRSAEIIFTAFIIYKAFVGEISIGDIALYIGFLVQADYQFWYMSFLTVISFSWQLDVMKSVLEFFDTSSEESKGKKRSLDTFYSLEFKDVCFKYPHTEKYILTGVSFTLNKGDKLSIVGINGAGKSTIIKLMLGLYTVDSGEILVNGCPMDEYDIYDIRKMFSALFQDFVHYPLTLRESVAMSSVDRRENDDEIITALKQSGVYEDILPKLENGLDSYMSRKFDDKGTELSKGQWQKIALARAYFKKASVVIFDEPSSALDAEAEDMIFKNFESISDGKTGVMISHRISSARMSNKVIVLEGGKIIESGTHDELVELNGLYAKLYNLQREKYTLKEEAK